MKVAGIRMGGWEKEVEGKIGMDGKWKYCWNEDLREDL
jgi:hypothetical protein